MVGVVEYCASENATSVELSTELRFLCYGFIIISVEIKDCRNDSDCEHGGTCLGQPQKGQCLCTFGWTGQLCEGKNTWVVAND